MNWISWFEEFVNIYICIVKEYLIFIQSVRIMTNSSKLFRYGQDRKDLRGSKESPDHEENQPLTGESEWDWSLKSIKWYHGIVIISKHCIAPGSRSDWDLQSLCTNCWPVTLQLCKWLLMLLWNLEQQGPSDISLNSISSPVGYIRPLRRQCSRCDKLYLKTTRKMTWLLFIKIH